MRKNIFPIKWWFAIITLSLIFESCNYQYDVVVEQIDGTTKKFKCKNGKDTLNSTVYRFYDWILVEKWNYVNGKKEGSLITYHPDGTIKIITNYISDTVHGVNKVYDSTGALIRRSFYIKNKQVLFEQLSMENENFPDTYKRKLVHKNKDNELIWAGELFLDKSGNPTNVGYYMSETDSVEYKGMYANINVKDTLQLDLTYSLRLYVTIPKMVEYPEILIGEFDKNLNCLDTIYFAKPNYVISTYDFSYRPNKVGNNYILGRFSSPQLADQSMYFFDDFYVK